MSKESGHSSCKGRRSAGSESPQPCPAPESLTVENVQRLERQYETDGRYSPGKAVEEYIRQTHLYYTQQRAKSGRTEQREKEGSQGSAGAQSLSGAIPLGIVKASDGSCDATVGGYGKLTNVSVASSYKFQVSDPNQSRAPSSTSHKKITSPGSGSKCTSPEDIGAQAHGSRECTQTDMDWNWQQKTEPDNGNVMKEESQPDSTELEIQDLENEIQGLVASHSFKCEDVRSEKLVEDGLYLFPDVGWIQNYDYSSKQNLIEVLLFPNIFTPIVLFVGVNSHLKNGFYCREAKIRTSKWMRFERIRSEIWEYSLKMLCHFVSFNIGLVVCWLILHEFLFPNNCLPIILHLNFLFCNTAVGHQMKTISYRLSAMKSPDQEEMFPTAEEQSDIFAIVSRGQTKVKCRGCTMHKQNFPKNNPLIIITKIAQSNPKSKIVIHLSTSDGIRVKQKGSSLWKINKKDTPQPESSVHENVLVSSRVSSDGGSIMHQSWERVPKSRSHEAKRAFSKCGALLLGDSKQTSRRTSACGQGITGQEVEEVLRTCVIKVSRKLKDPSMLLKPSLDVHCQELKDKTLQIYDILEKIRNAVKYPHRSQTEKTPSQYNLTAQIQRPEEKAAKKHELHPSTKAAIKRNRA
ncbi:glutamate-rich protein 6-like isoform X1 [Acipenser oxyrinchus oxyrinchus]|uniref:Glutamate-rich protein 6-like isoform X1 n=1 Tax=Acipenser oxyrinchus oxyrinchus TaxID=40147 RepID=A0AAD8G4M4_ACIOX|nr:glutamate-rich protein 6-like isoform X1 [Acipenser oxyrinchus oxyrinchus]